MKLARLSLPLVLAATLAAPGCSSNTTAVSAVTTPAPTATPAATATATATAAPNLVPSPVVTAAPAAGQGGSLHLDYTGGSADELSGTAFNAALVTLSAGASAEQLSFIATAPNRTFSLQLAPTAPKAGQTLQAAALANATTCAISYSQSDNASGTAKTRTWSSTAGTVTIDAAAGGVLSFTMHNVVLSPFTAQGANALTPKTTFTVNGSGKAQGYPGL